MSLIRNTRNRRQNIEPGQHLTRPVRPRPEELVPSRYALKVGEIDVLVVSDGVLPLANRDAGHTTPTRPSGRPG